MLQHFPSKLVCRTQRAHRFFLGGWVFVFNGDLELTVKLNSAYIISGFNHYFLQTTICFLTLFGDGVVLLR